MTDLERRLMGEKLFTKADELRLRALASLGIDEESLGECLSVRVDLRSKERWQDLTVSIHSADRKTGLNVGVEDRPFLRDDFKAESFVQPSGRIWHSPDSSFDVDRIGTMIDKIAQIQNGLYIANVSLVAFVRPGTLAAESH